LLALDATTSEITTVVTILQGLSTLLNREKAQLEGLVQWLVLLCPVQGTSNADVFAEVDGAGSHVIRGSFSVAHTDAGTFINYQGIFLMHALEALALEDTEILVCSVAGLFAGPVKGITAVVAGRDRSNNASDNDLPAILQHDLCRLRTSIVCISIRRQEVRGQRTVLRC
jgi:hypothetical protein